MGNVFNFKGNSGPVSTFYYFLRFYFPTSASSKVSIGLAFILGGEGLLTLRAGEFSYI